MTATSTTAARATPATTRATTTAVPAAEATTTSTAETLVYGRPGDGAAALRVEELYARHGSTVLGLCRVLLRNNHEAEDAGQQTFLSAYRSILNGVEPRHPAAWLATIARNECWATIEKRMRRPLADAEIESSLPDPVVAAAERADLGELWRAIGELPGQQRQALLLREFSGLSYEELAASLGVSGPAVESLLFRARRELRTRLKPVYGCAVLTPWNAFRDSLPPFVIKAGVGATAVILAGGTVAAVEGTHVLRDDVSTPEAAAATPRVVRAPAPAAPAAHAAPIARRRTAATAPAKRRPVHAVVRVVVPTASRPAAAEAPAAVAAAPAPPAPSDPAPASDPVPAPAPAASAAPDGGVTPGDAGAAAGDDGATTETSGSGSDDNSGSGKDDRGGSGGSSGGDDDKSGSSTGSGDNGGGPGSDGSSGDSGGSGSGDSGSGGDDGSSGSSGSGAGSGSGGSSGHDDQP